MINTLLNYRKVQMPFIRMEVKTQANEIIKSDSSIHAKHDFENTSININDNNIEVPYVEITEQPKSNGLRFRYECEKRSSGSLKGISSTPTQISYPSIKIWNSIGRAAVTVSCVTSKRPYRPHPHMLIGEFCENGIYRKDISDEQMTVTFKNLGIQCVKRNDVRSALSERSRIGVDPYGTGFESIDYDLNSIRLCFQVSIESTHLDQPCNMVSLHPILSEPIYNKKSIPELTICKLGTPSCSAAGSSDQETFIFCEKVCKNDIKIEFFELDENGGIVWNDFANIHSNDVHKQTSIAFKIPPYKSQNIDRPVQCFVRLYRPSDGAMSEAIPFKYYPIASSETAH